MTSLEAQSELKEIRKEIDGIASRLIVLSVDLAHERTARWRLMTRTLKQGS